MKNLNNPQIIPRKEDLPQHVSDLFQQTDEALRELGEVYEQKHVAIDKPRDGNVVYADGADWDPGFGEGFYFYAAAQWFPMFSVGPRRITGFTSSGNYSKPDWLRHALVLCIGGGGGGGTGTANTNSGGGGGEGACSAKLYLASALSASETVTIGAGGAAGAAGATTSFDTQTAGGGGAGSGATAGQGSTVGANSDFVLAGVPGQHGVFGSAQYGGHGGGRQAGRGGVAAAGEAGAANLGAGGGGGACTAGTGYAGGAGAGGRVLVFEF